VAGGNGKRRTEKRNRAKMAGEEKNFGNRLLEAAGRDGHVPPATLKLLVVFGRLPPLRVCLELRFTATTMRWEFFRAWGGWESVLSGPECGRGRLRAHSVFPRFFLVPQWLRVEFSIAP